MLLQELGLMLLALAVIFLPFILAFLLTGSGVSVQQEERAQDLPQENEKHI